MGSGCPGRQSSGRGDSFEVLDPWGGVVEVVKQGTPLLEALGAPKALGVGLYGLPSNQK